MRNIVRIKFGSHLYGTSTPASDLDFKSVYVPDRRSILLQRVRPTISTKRPKSEGEKNYAGEQDEESHSLQRFLSLAAEGQTVAIDMLFAPDWALTDDPSWQWQEILDNRHRLLTKKSAAFVGYVRTQAQKYGIKGSRVAAARDALRILDHMCSLYGDAAKIGNHAHHIETAAATEHSSVVELEQASGAMIKHWNVCGRKIPYTVRLRAGREIVQRLVDEYGQRAIQAESNQGIDWKALSHAVRVGTQAIELLKTANVTFPLPNAAHVLAIKLGKLPYKEVGGEIEELLVAVEAAAESSSLPDKPDLQWIDDFVCSVYHAEVFDGGGGRFETESKAPQ
jgi:hypothetical protein